MKINDLLGTMDRTETRIELYSLNSYKRIAYTHESLKKYGETNILTMRMVIKPLTNYSNTVAPYLLVYATDAAIQRAKELYDRTKEDNHGIQP